MRWLSLKELLHGRILDYGCGRGVCADHIGAEKYDPYWFPEKPEGVFNVVTCNYVLNVIADPQERENVLRDIISLLSVGGTAYVSVRNDRDVTNGFLPNGAFQGYVSLGAPWCLIRETSRYKIYAYNI
jgi:2-polyprenyl-3-methyl-5-hydroxy-6-metoxy-1,4-benzoquinol methylase